MNADFKINGKELETNRLILRSFLPGDLYDFNEYASVPGVGEMAGWTHHKSLDESKDILDKFIKEDKTFALIYKENGKVIGSLGVEFYGREESLTEFEGLIGREIGAVLSKDYWGRGIMCEAINEVSNYLFNDLGFDFILAAYFLRNSQSKRLQEKCGFKAYRKLTIEAVLGKKELSICTLLLNPNKDIKLSFSHPETLIYEK